METKIDLSSITVGSEDDHMGGYEFGDTITLSSTNYANTVVGGVSDPYYGAVPNVSITTGSNTAPYTLTGGPYTIGTGIRGCI